MTPNEVIAKVKNLPAVSQAALKLVTLLDQPAVSNEDVVTVLKYDNVLTAKLLRACNSPYFGFEEQISSVEQAVLILGHQQILHMVLSLAFGGAMSTRLPGYAIEAKELWSHSLTTAVAAEQLVKERPADGSRSRPWRSPPVCCTTSANWRCIKCSTPARKPPSAIASFNSACPGTSRKRKFLEPTTAKSAPAFWRPGGCPIEIVEAVAHHHSPVGTPQPKLSAVIHVSNCLVHLIGSTLGWECYAVIADAGANRSAGHHARKTRMPDDQRSRFRAAG